jgi:hypothetical protein
MRWICWASVFLAAFALIRPAVGSESISGWEGTCTSCDQGYGFGAPPCAAPFFGWQPGCCQEPPTACDNAWAGYCCEKARWKAFWYRVGTGGRSCYGSMPGNCQPTPPSPQPVIEPAPMAPAKPGKTPAPATPAEPGKPSPPPAPGSPGKVPLPPPPNLDEPVALPPMPAPLPDETTLKWNRFWRPGGTAWTQPTNWLRLR